MLVTILSLLFQLLSVRFRIFHVKYSQAILSQILGNGVKVFIVLFICIYFGVSFTHLPLLHMHDEDSPLSLPPPPILSPYSIHLSHVLMLTPLPQPF